MTYDLIVITGPTATGKTRFAAELASILNGEIISADSRQVFRGMNLGTGKDLQDYMVDGQQVPVHLIDVIDAGEKYSVFRFQQDFIAALDDVKNRNKTPILCGGTGLYIESVINNYRMPNVPENAKLRAELAKKNLKELTQTLATLKTMHNNTDVDTCNRAIRAIEIAMFEKNNPEAIINLPKLNCIVLGLKFDRSIIRSRITQRLQHRIKEGMIEEVRQLIENGVDTDILISYGLEYKFTTWLIQNRITYPEYFSQLNTAIHQFAKRQTTWFRRMERNGIPIHWIDGNLLLSQKIEIVNAVLGSTL